jgi:hypothetical protein
MSYFRELIERLSKMLGLGARAPQAASGQTSTPPAASVAEGAPDGER